MVNHLIRNQHILLSLLGAYYIIYLFIRTRTYTDTHTDKQEENNHNNTFDEDDLRMI